MSTPSLSAEVAGSSSPSALSPPRSSDRSFGMVGSGAASPTALASTLSSSSSADPSAHSSASLPAASAVPAPSFASWPLPSVSALPALLPSSSRGPSVTVEDESTKRCSACSEDRPSSEFSSAQLKKKGKRVCASCVSAKDLASSSAAAASAASARKDSMRPAFVSKLASVALRGAVHCRGCNAKKSKLAQCDRCKTDLCSVGCFDKHHCEANHSFEVKISAAQERPAVQCPCCRRQTTRLVPCSRCTVDCCSLRCFDQHDSYLEAKRTMPTELIPEEDRFHSEAEMTAGWQELLEYSCAVPGMVGIPFFLFAPKIRALRSLDSAVSAFLSSLHSRLSFLYSPCVSRPWWTRPNCIHLSRLVKELHRHIADITVATVSILELSVDLASAAAATEAEREAQAHGDCVPAPSLVPGLTCRLPTRLSHKLLTLLCWIVRTMGPDWIAVEFHQTVDVSKVEFGTLLFEELRRTRLQSGLGYLEQSDPDTGLPTLVPLVGYTAGPCKVGLLRLHLGRKHLIMITHDRRPVLERGLFLSLVPDGSKSLELSAVTGWIGKGDGSFTAASTEAKWLGEEWLREHPTEATNKELEARKRSDYFHLIPALQQALPADEWPREFGSALFIATPQRGIESELVELSLLELLAEDAAAGNEQAQLLIAHIDEECSAPIAEVIAAQNSRLDQMFGDQAEQLRFHAEAVKRAELRGRIKAPTADEDGGAAASSAASSASASSTSASAVAPGAAASSSAVSEARSSSSTHGPAFSWTQSREFKSLASLREPGRLKYRTIMSAAKKLLYSLRPVSVNKRGGSHLVFHASGAPATLVQMHAGSRSKDSTAYSTRLYEQLNIFAMQQLGGRLNGATEEAVSEIAAGGAGVGRLLK